jgi:prolyl 4-hydroxylase
LRFNEQPVTVLPPEAHIAARAGNLIGLEKQLDGAGADQQKTILTQRDEHGWQILHQGVASGMQQVVELLVSRGADINARTHGGYGETPLRIAEQHLGAAHQVVQYLKSMGALSIGPEL